MASVYAATDPNGVSVLTVEEVAALLRIGRTKAYEMARLYLRTSGREGIPTIAFGRLMRCPTHAVLAMIQADLGDPGDAA